MCPVQVSDRFDATGKKVTETKATGSVTFLSKDPTRRTRSPAGSVVRTAAGVAFRTKYDRHRARRRASRGSRSCRGPPTVAVDGGEGRARGQRRAEHDLGRPGRRGPGAPRGPQPRGHDRRDAGVDPAGHAEGRRRRAEDARQPPRDALRRRRRGPGPRSLGRRSSCPARSVLGATTPTPDPATIVGQQVDAFDLTLAATGAITAYAPADVRAVALAQLFAAAPAGTSVVDGTATVEVGDRGAGRGDRRHPHDGECDGRSARSTPRPCAPPCAGSRPLRPEPRWRRTGTCTVVVWPGFVPTVTGTDTRIDVVVVPAEGSSGPRPRPRRRRRASTARRRASRDPPPRRRPRGEADRSRARRSADRSAAPARDDAARGHDREGCGDARRDRRAGGRRRGHPRIAARLRRRRGRPGHEDAGLGREHRGHPRPAGAPPGRAPLERSCGPGDRTHEAGTVGRTADTGPASRVPRRGSTARRRRSSCATSWPRGRGGTCDERRRGRTAGRSRGRPLRAVAGGPPRSRPDAPARHASSVARATVPAAACGASACSPAV